MNYYNYILDAFLSSFKSFSTTTSQKVAMSDNYNNVITNDFKESPTMSVKDISWITLTHLYKIQF